MIQSFSRRIRSLLPGQWRLKLAELLLNQNVRLPRQLWEKLRKSVLSRYGNNPRGMWIGARISDRMGEEAFAHNLRGERLVKLLVQQEKAEDLDQIVALMGELENFGKTGPFAVGRRISLMLSTPTKRTRLLRAVKKGRKRHRRSAFLLHLETMIVAMQGGYRQAAADLVREIGRLSALPPSAENQYRVTNLQNAWRVVDRIARDHMDWSMEDDGDTDAADLPEETDAESGTKVQEIAEQVTDADHSFGERALQNRRREEYLQMCRVRFAKADRLDGRIKAIQDMLRIGIRRVPHYGSSFAEAAECLERLEPDLDEVMDSHGLPSRVELESVCSALYIAQRLKREPLASEIRDWLVALAGRPGIGCLAWEAAEALTRESATRSSADAIMELQGHLPPETNRDVKNFLSWAMRCHRHDEAHSFARRLPPKLRRCHGMLYYVHILQRESRFDEALDLVRMVHAQSLTNPLRANPVTNASLITRTGELEFLRETAKLHSAVPQPKHPVGLIMVMARNIDQLRRVPLTALVEFKRRGWAVIPLVEGLLPIEPTGIAEINVLIGSVTPHTWLSPAAERAMPDLKDFRFDAAAGRLTWAEMDLSHALWEDAAINRRRHSIDWSCPELQITMGALADWTRSFGRAFEHAHRVGRSKKISVGTISLFNYRLPDALPRFYCESRGQKDWFFHLHAANGYQNYFTNFSTNISHRFVLRNMTRHPEARSASFPLPENFEAYYASRRREATTLLEHYGVTTKVKRSTEGQTELPPEALAARARILDWRAKGGKIACAFGKVVCDSGVPFDGGPCHRDMKDWINSCIRAVQGSNTLLLIKPHPHELNNQIATFPTEYFADLIEEPLNNNALFLGHRWFDMHDMRELMDLGVIYNGTTTIELGLMGIPAILSGHFAPIDYPIGQIVPQRREEYDSYLRFDRPAKVPDDLALRAAVWLDYMANENFTQPYRFHARPVTNKVLYPPYWFRDDLRAAAEGKNDSARELVDRALGLKDEPVSASRPKQKDLKPAEKRPKKMTTVPAKPRFQRSGTEANLAVIPAKEGL